MKYLLFLTTFLLLLTVATVEARTPFQPEVYSEFLNVYNGAQLKKKHLVNFADGETYASGASISLSNLYFPPSSVITEVAVYTKTPPTSASDNLVSLTCESASDLLTQTDFTDDSAGDLIAGAVTGYSNEINTAGDGCTVVLEVGPGTTGITAGELILLFKYERPDFFEF